MIDFKGILRLFSTTCNSTIQSTLPERVNYVAEERTQVVIYVKIFSRIRQSCHEEIVNTLDDVRRNFDVFEIVVCKNAALHGTKTQSSCKTRIAFSNSFIVQVSQAFSRWGRDPTDTL